MLQQSLARVSRAVRGPSVSHRLADLASPHVKVVRRERAFQMLEREKEQLLQRLSASPLRAADVCEGELGVDSPVLRALDGLPDLQERCRRDVADISTVFREHLGVDAVAVKLQAVHGTACPRFHMDKVGMRMVCTYLGSGTEYLASEATLVVGDRIVATLEDCCEAAGTGDLLFLKGVQAGSSGAVHRSPATHAHDVRLILVIDDAVQSIQYFLRGS